MSFTSGYKVNANTDYEFTVSNETISEIVQNGGITEQDIANYCYTALIDNRVYSLHSLASMASQEGGYDGFIAEYCPYYIARGTINPLLNVDMTSTHDEIYERNFLTWVGSIYPGTENEKYGTFLVMDIKDIKKWYMDFNTGCYVKNNVASTITKSGVTTPMVGYTGDCYYYNDNNMQRAIIKSTSEETVNESLYIKNVLIINGEYWVGELNPSSGGNSKTFESMNNWNAFTPSYLRGYLNHEDGHIYQAGSIDFAGIPKLYDIEFPDARDADLVSYIESDNGVLIYTRCNRSELPSHSCMYPKNLETALTWASWCGLKFKFGDVFYKPIIKQGVIVGYSNDMSAPSEYDNMSNVTGNNILPTPPAPPKPDANDNEIDVTMSAFTPSAGFVHYIEMTYEKLVTLASSFNSYNASIWNIGGDLMKNLISLKVFACSGTHSGIIKNIHIAGHEMTDGNNNPISGNYINDLGAVDLGTIQVGSQFRFDDWRDFAPYTKIECFVPCCGWAQLPPWVMGRTVTGTLYIDLPNGSCKAVIKAGRTPVAEIGGCCAVDMPLSSVATGAKAAGIITSLANGAVSAFNPTPQNLISGSFGIVSAFNANFTETKGSMGDGSNINGCTEFLIKVTRPASTDTGNGEITNRYKHEKGIPCAKTKTLASGQGFTQIMDANIDGTMTDREKQMIIDGFRHGLIL